MKPYERVQRLQRIEVAMRTNEHVRRIANALQMPVEELRELGRLDIKKRELHAVAWTTTHPHPHPPRKRVPADIARQVVQNAVPAGV
jgi:hypothetical protein